MAHNFSENALYCTGKKAFGLSLIIKGVSSLFDTDNYSMRKSYYKALSPVTSDVKLYKELV